MTTEQIEQVELSIEHATKSIAMMDSLRKLVKNKDFTLIVTEGYFEKEASRLVLLRADPSMQGIDDQKTIDNQIIAVGYLRQYFTTIFQMGRMAEKALRDDEETREELLKEEL